MKKKVFHLPQDSISDIVGCVNENKNQTLTKEELLRGELLVEETYLRLAKGMNTPDLSATVTVKKRFGDINLEISARGEAVNPLMSLSEWIEDESDLFSANLLKANRHLLGYSRRNGENVVFIKLHEGGGQQIFRMVVSMVLGVVFGFIMRTMVPTEAFLWIEENLASFVTTVFMHALTMMVPPLIFSAIVSGITNMSETADLGRIGARLLGQSTVLMFCTAVLSVGLGYLFFGEDLSHLAVLFKGGGNAAGGFSMKEMFFNIVPENLVDPFRGGNLMQVLFLSIFFGIVLNRMGEKAHLARELIDFINNFCLSIMGIVTRMIPLVVFFSIAGLVFHTDISVLLALGKVIFGQIISVPICFGVYAVFIAVYGKLSPMPFLRKMAAFSLLPFAVCSSNGILPQTLKFVTKKLGVAGSMASFSLPLGIPLHKVGSCFVVILPAMMMARVCNTPMDGEFFLSLIFFTLLILLTVPTVPGADVIAMSSVFAAVGLPVGAVTFFLCVNPVVDMFCTVDNVACNVCSSVLLARKEGSLDEGVYRSM